MDAVFFGLKRGFHATLRCGRPLLARVGLTPARFDVLYALTDERIPKTQAGLRRALGVGRPTISEMLGALERHGLIVRTRDEKDRRTRRVWLTKVGRDLFQRAYALVIGEGIVPLAVESALSQGNASVDVFPVREALEWHCTLIRRFFGDPAIRELYPWHPEDFGGLELECLSELPSAEDYLLMREAGVS